MRNVLFLMAEIDLLKWMTNKTEHKIRRLERELNKSHSRMKAFSLSRKYPANWFFSGNVTVHLDGFAQLLAILLEIYGST